MIDGPYEKAIKRGYWLGKKEHQILLDAWPLPDLYAIGDVQLSVQVGPPYPEELQGADWFKKDWAALNRLRIDLVVAAASGVHVIEITPTVGSGTTGKTKLYQHFYALDNDMSKDQVQPGIIGRSANESIYPYCLAADVNLGFVEEGGPLTWQVKNW